MRSVITAGIAGLLFALGLGLGGMTDPGRVVNFLDVTGSWDPSLAFVMAGALGTYAVARRLILRRSRPLCAPAFPPLGRSRVDGRLMMGATLFGMGWGLTGYCPGPALTSLASGGRSTGIFVLAMAGGMILFQLWERGRSARTAASVSVR